MEKYFFEIRAQPARISEKLKTLAVLKTTSWETLGLENAD